MSSYDDLCIVYDNFNYLKQAHHQVVGDTGAFYSYTTGKIMCGSCIPNGGLQQQMFHEKVPIHWQDVLEAPGNLYDDVQEQISTSFIADAIQHAYPDAVQSIFHYDHKPEYPHMPIINVLKPAKTTHMTLEPILEDEDSISSNYSVLENIFVNQLHLNHEVNFDERLYLVYGDQKTVKLIHGCKRERAEVKSAYDHHGWVLPVPDLWHVRLNFLYMIMRTHFGSKKYSQQHSTLYTHMNHLEQRNIPAEKASFHHLEKLVLHSFNTHVVALFLTHISSQKDIKKAGAAEEYIQQLTPSQFLQHVENIRIAGFGQKIGHEANVLCSSPSSESHGKKSCWSKKQLDTAASASSQSVQIVDVEFLNHVHFLQLVETYKTLKYIIKFADIGILKHAIAHSCLYFAGADAKNYGPEMLYFWKLVATGACDPPLQRAILANGLVNNQGKPDTFFKVDHLNELLNLELKELLQSCGNSTFGIENLFKWSVLTTSYTASLKEKFECVFDESTKNSHTIKSPTADIQALVDLIAHDSIRQQRVRAAKWEMPALLQLGYDQLLSGSIDDFNAKYIDGGNDAVDSANLDPSNSMEEIADLPQDLWLFSLMVS